jgi:uncharacterized protein with NAD-binding domain and iron-sulfur cluster
VAQPRVAVVGAGLAGLAAAVDLADAGIAVEIFERSRLLGGRATSFVVGGREVDNGQHVFLACCTEFVDLVTRLGLADQLFLQPRFEALMIARGGRVSRLRAASLPAPWHLAASLFGFRLMSWRARLRVAKALLNAARGRSPEPQDVARGRSPEPQDVARGRSPLTRRSKIAGDATFANWLVAHNQQEEELKAFWEPFFVPALNAPLDQVSAGDAIVVLQTAFLRDPNAARFGFSKVPLAHIAAAAAQRADRLHLSTPIAALDLDPSGAAARGVVTMTGERIAFDAIVLALTPAQLARVLGDDASRYGLSALDAFIPYPIVDVHLWHDGGRSGFDFAALVGSPVQWVFEKSAGYLCCSMSAAGEFLVMPTERLEGICWSEVTSSVPAIQRAQLLEAAVTRNPDATYLPARHAVRPGSATAIANVGIAGSWTATGWPDTMESAVRSGRAAARHIKSQLENVARPANAGHSKLPNNSRSMEPVK